MSTVCSHDASHPLAGQTVTVVADLAGAGSGPHAYQVEDWADRVYGRSWMGMNGNPSALYYAMRAGFSDRRIPTDDEVVYGKVGNRAFLVHHSEIAGEA
jgi:hypothetical protein